MICNLNSDLKFFVSAGNFAVII